MNDKKIPGTTETRPDTGAPGTPIELATATPAEPTARNTSHVTRDRDPAKRLAWKRQRAIDLGDLKP